jgi:hypothetical protein
MTKSASTSGYQLQLSILEVVIQIKNNSSVPYLVLPTVVFKTEIPRCHQGQSFSVKQTSTKQVSRHERVARTFAHHIIEFHSSLSLCFMPPAPHPPTECSTARQPSVQSLTQPGWHVKLRHQDQMRLHQPLPSNVPLQRCMHPQRYRQQRSCQRP